VGEGTGKSFLTFINARLTQLHSLWARPRCSSSCSSRAFDYHVAISLADVRVIRSRKEFLFTGSTKNGNYIKIPSRSLSNGWYKTLIILHY